MIQRIQSIYLAIIAALCFTVASVKLYELAPGETAKGSTIFTATVWKVLSTDKGNSSELMSSPALGLILVLTGFLALITAWLFKARKKQIALCKVMLLLSLAWVGLFLSEINTLRIMTGAGYQFKIYPFTALVVLIPVFTLLALRGIKKDEELVRSADRLR
ncbi:MAG: DUF4293 domain-containing protein [Bacteroidota bacterium]